MTTAKLTYTPNDKKATPQVRAHYRVAVEQQGQPNTEQDFYLLPGKRGARKCARVEAESWLRSEFGISTLFSVKGGYSSVKPTRPAKVILQDGHAYVDLTSKEAPKPKAFAAAAGFIGRILTNRAS
jgi:hypothetical protein